MLNEFQSYHEPLFKSEHALKLGQIHCMILVADNIYEKRAGLQKNISNEKFDFSPVELTLFGEETAGNFIKWWVRKNVINLGQITKRIEEIMPHLDDLKRASLKMNQDSSINKYEKLIVELRDFVEKHGKDIDALYDFVSWLNELGDLGPCVLFTHPPWSTTQLSDRYLRIEKCNESHVQRSTEIALGLWSHGMPTLARIRNEMEGDWAQSVDPEYAGGSTITYESAFPRASRTILNEFALYFQRIRDSVELVQSEVISFSKEDILKNEEFLKLFISKVLPEHRLECELWDFKKTISAWCNMKVPELQSNFAFSLLLYETGARYNEAQRLEWTDLDPERNKVTIKASKNGKSRTLSVSKRLMSILLNLPKTEKQVTVFKRKANGTRQATFRKRMKMLARTHNNPRFLKTHYHTFRHCKALREYHKTKSILHVKKILGHRNIMNTQRYLELYTEIYGDLKPENYICEIAQDTKEAKKLIEQGFDYVTGTYDDGGKLFRKVS